MPGQGLMRSLTLPELWIRGSCSVAAEPPMVTNVPLATPADIEVLQLASEMIRPNSCLLTAPFAPGCVTWRGHGAFPKSLIPSQTRTGSWDRVAESRVVKVQALKEALARIRGYEISNTP